MNAHTRLLHLLRRALTAALLLIVPWTAVPAAQPSLHWFPISGSPLFNDVRAQLQRLVDQDGHHRNNDFCVVGQQSGADKQAYVHWITENRLILWEPQRDNPRAIAGSRRNLDLARDVVPGNDVGGSTYRLTRPIADRIIAACRHRGMRFAIRKSVTHAE